MDPGLELVPLTESLEDQKKSVVLEEEFRQTPELDLGKLCPGLDRDHHTCLRCGPRPSLIFCRVCPSVRFLSRRSLHRRVQLPL